MAVAKDGIKKSVDYFETIMQLCGHSWILCYWKKVYVYPHCQQRKSWRYLRIVGRKIKWINYMKISLHIALFH